MYKGLIDHLAFIYGFICKGRGKLEEKDLRKVTEGTHTVVRTAPAVLGMEDITKEDGKDLQLALKMDRQIEEAMVFLLSLENT
jgi:hypothetical protein